MRSRLWKFWMIVLGVCLILSSCTSKAGSTATIEPTLAPEPTKTSAAQSTQAFTATTSPEPTATMVAPPPVSVKPSQTKIVIFVGFGTGSDPEQQAIHQQIQDDFNASHTDIQIEWMVVPYEERITKLTTMIAGDMAPDILMPIGVSGIAENFDEWIDISPFIQADNYDMTRLPLLILYIFTQRFFITSIERTGLID